MTARAGRGESARFAGAHALPALVRGFVGVRPRAVPGHAGPGRPRWSAATLRALRERHGGAPVLVRGLTGTVLLILDPQDIRQFYAEPVGSSSSPPERRTAIAPTPGSAPGGGRSTTPCSPRG